MTSPVPRNPIFNLVDHVLMERMRNTMFIQHEGPYYDVMDAVKRDFTVIEGDIVRWDYRFERPQNSTDSYVRSSETYSQRADLSKPENNDPRWKHVSPLWRVRKPLLDELNITFLIDHPDGIMPMIPLSRNFHCVEVLPAIGHDDTRDYQIAFFSETDAIAAQAMMLVPD